MSDTIESLRAAIKELEQTTDSAYDEATRDVLKRLLENRVAALEALEALAPAPDPPS